MYRMQDYTTSNEPRMRNEDTSEHLEAIRKGFSGRQNKLVEKIKDFVDEEIAIALVGMQGVKGTSHSEIEVVANLISLFTSLKIRKITQSPRSLVIQGNYLKDYFVEIIPQYASGKYSIDLVVKLFVSKSNLQIASIGIEYDGHDAHYVESNIKKSYKRDSDILANEGIPLIKISPEQKKEIDPTRKNISKYLKHRIRDFENGQKHAVKNRAEYVGLTKKSCSGFRRECPVCEGLGSLANVYCPTCNGIGRIGKEIIDPSMYSYFNCPDCHASKSSFCRTCLGKQWIDRDKAIEWQKRHNDKKT